jgi:hypothetical protein
LNSFYIISSLILFGLTGLCFWLPYKAGNKTIGLSISIILGLIITLTLIADLDFLVIFIWPIIIAIQIVFISYWTFRTFNRKKIGTISATILTFVFLLIALSPWTTDWTFNNQDVKEILTYHGIELKDDFEIERNESGGFRDYYQTFTIKISGSDYQKIAEKIKTSKNYIGLYTDLTKQLPRADYRKNDTMDFETNYHFEREYWSQQRMDDGTFHFRFQLSKTDKELSYIGSNE